MCVCDCVPHKKFGERECFTLYNSEFILLTLSLTNLDHFLKDLVFTSTPFPQQGLPGSVVSWWRFSVVVAFLLIQQASILQCSRVEIRMSRKSESAPALALSEIAMPLGKAFNSGSYAKIMALWRLFCLTSHSNMNQLVLVLLVCDITGTIVFMAPGCWGAGMRYCMQSS